MKKKNTNYEPQTAEFFFKKNDRLQIQDPEFWTSSIAGRSTMGNGDKLSTSPRTKQLCTAMQTERYESSFGCKHRQQKLARHKMKVKSQMAIKKGHSQKMTPMVHTDMR